MLGKIALTLAAALTVSSQTATSQSVKTQPMLDYSFAPAISPGSRIGDHIFQNNIRVTGPVAFDDSGNVAFYGQWFGAAVGGANSRGIYTSNRVVVEEGSKVGSSSIVAIINVRAGDLQMNGAGQVAYLATIDSKLCGSSSSCTGLFVERDLRAVAVVPSATYVLAEDGKIQSSTAAMWLKPAAAGGGKGSWLAKIGGTISPSAQKLNLPVIGPVVVAPKPIELGQKGATNNGSQSAGFVAPTAYPNCPVPTGFAFPKLWPSNGNAAGPVGSSNAVMGWGQMYRTVAQVDKGNWYRKTFFSFDCRAILVSIAPAGAPTAEELWTPAGLLINFDAAGGVYHLEGIGDATLPPSSTPIEDGIRINRRCQVLIPVTLRTTASNESALVLATPTNPGHCQ